MATRYDIRFPKTYATEKNAVKAVEKIYGGERGDGLTYILVPVGDRFGVVFFGAERSVRVGVHFHFNVIG